MEMTNHSNQYYSCIDVVKVVMAIFVVAIHTQPELCLQSDWARFLLSKLFNVAVPFFFVISGFLLWTKMDGLSPSGKLARVESWLYRALRLYVVWSIIYLPYAVYGFKHDGVGFSTAVIVYLRNFCFVGENFGSWNLWYLLALVVSGCLILISLKCGLEKRGLAFLACGLLFVGHLISAFGNSGVSTLYYRVFKTLRNGFFAGFPYMVVGILISGHKILPKWILTVLFLCSMALYFAGFRIALIVVIWSFFSILIQMRFNINHSISTCLRLSSKVIYLMHMLWLGLLSLTVNLNPCMLFVAVLALSIGCSVIAILNRDTEMVRLLFA